MEKMFWSLVVILGLIFGYSHFFGITEMNSFSREDLAKVVGKNTVQASTTTNLVLVGKVLIPFTNETPQKYEIDVKFIGYTKTFNVSELVYNKYSTEDEIPVMVYHREKVKRKKVISYGETFELKE